MKKILLVCLLGVFSMPSLANEHLISADSQTVVVQAQGGFKGPSRSKHIIKDVISALNASDNTKVNLTGRLIMSLGDEDYVFQDSTGEITVEIDNDIWYGRTITPENHIVLRGEVEKDWNNTSIEVDSLEVLQ
ncbi:YgiW/YdeI family stress tolerance OB fold protein [Vibrio rumoiensis]|uniref:YgiW/YdeI family stress tolerance OB fold protein n=1 Tax=Vibrio rumoiensis TaxID=76258 RepID=UPI0002E76658|nr:NirD/YgiW/YdeI family stress tolerance protein [Vibrio rumoiensis]